MKESPILFSTSMVQAILEGRKTMTRRIFKDNPRIASDLSEIDLKQWFMQHTDYLLSFSQYGQYGDLLWVRETFAPMVFEDYDGDGNDKEGWIYKADNGSQDILDNCEDSRWKSSLFMPKVAARIWMEITDIEVERLHDISQSDAKKEGVNHVIDKITGYCGYDYLSGGYNLMTTPYLGFMSLWKKINGKESWDSNPWVWVITFKVLSTTGRPSL